jgi:hypothetical protein
LELPSRRFNNCTARGPRGYACRKLPHRHRAFRHTHTHTHTVFTVIQYVTVTRPGLLSLSLYDRHTLGPAAAVTATHTVVRSRYRSCESATAFRFCPAPARQLSAPLSVMRLPCHARAHSDPPTPPHHPTPPPPTRARCCRIFDTGSSHYDDRHVSTA